MEPIFFDSWRGLARTLVIGVAGYATLVFFLRIAGNRTLSKMNAFDLIVTVALGSCLATLILSQDVALAEGATAFAVLIGLQFAVTWSSTRAPWVRRAVTGEPRLIVHRGDFLDDQLRAARVARDEVRAAVRAQGIGQMADVEGVVLETDGSFSVVERVRIGDASTFAGVRGGGRLGVSTHKSFQPSGG